MLQHPDSQKAANKRLSILPVLGVLILPCALFCLLHLKNNYYTANQPLFQFINGANLGADWMWQNITFLGDWLAAFVLIALFSRRAPRILWQGLLVSVIAGVGVHVCKAIFDMARPAAQLSSDQIHIIGEALYRHSFPSGHSATGFALAGLLIYHLHRYWRYPLLIAASLVAWSRVKVGAHWPTDVLVGSLLGWYAVKLALVLDNRWRWIGETFASQIVLYTIAVFSALSLWWHDSGYPQAKITAQTLSVIAILMLLATMLERFLSRTSTTSPHRKP